jgi:hypothetical protein
VKLQLKALVKLLEDQDMGMVYSDAALEEIARVGYDPVFGARPLQRTIQKVIENPISTLIIKGDMKAGDVVSIDFNGTDFVFEVGRGKLFEEDAKQKMFLCETTNRTFKTIVLPNSTVISPYCGSTKVKPLYDAEAEKLEAEKKEKDKKEGTEPGKEGEAKAKDPNAPVDPNAPPTDPNAPADPKKPVDPNAPPTDPNAPAGDAMTIPNAPLTPEQAAQTPPAVAPVNTVPTQAPVQDAAAGIVMPDIPQGAPPAAPEAPPANGQDNTLQFGGGGQLSVN